MMQKNKFIINFAKEKDAFDINRIEKECFSQPWSSRQIEDEIKKENVIFLTAKINDVLCGYVSGQLILDEFYISNIAVYMPYRDKKIATELLNTLINILSQKNCSFITLEVRESNLSARHLYEKSGFINLGIRKNFYSFPQENACIYTFYF